MTQNLAAQSSSAKHGAAQEQVDPPRTIAGKPRTGALLEDNARTLLSLRDGVVFPIRIVITSFVPAKPENFVVRSRKIASSTHIHNTSGAWMNAAKGGEKNTLDIFFALVDANGNVVKLDEPLPIKVKLWTVTRCFSLVTPLCEVTDPDKRRGNATFSTSGVRVLERGDSRMYVATHGHGFLKCKIMATSKQHDDKKFSLEILPNLLSKNARQKFGWLFPREADYMMMHGYKYVQVSSLTFPIEIMSKINYFNEKKRNFDASQTATEENQAAVLNSYLKKTVKSESPKRKKLNSEGELNSMVSKSRVGPSLEQIQNFYPPEVLFQVQQAIAQQLVQNQNRSAVVNGISPGNPNEIHAAQVLSTGEEGAPVEEPDEPVDSLHLPSVNALEALQTLAAGRIASAPSNQSKNDSTAVEM
eukprot:snap_masked-scaffold_12-processed-gene-7.24-mRNA-1 protein AED:1.00 eAED:1.00 QI:0/-1/0/0/-1/1/1/0/415